MTLDKYISVTYPAANAQQVAAIKTFLTSPASGSNGQSFWITGIRGGSGGGDPGDHRGITGT